MTWVHVDDKLPEDSQECLVRVCGGLFDKPRESLALWRHNTQLFCELPGLDDFKCPEMVTHWKEIS